MAKRLEAEEKRREAERKWEEAAAKAAVESARNEKLVQRLANLRASLQEAATAARFEREILALKKQHVVISESDSSDDEGWTEQQSSTSTAIGNSLSTMPIPSDDDSSDY